MELSNYVGGAWRRPRGASSAPVINPATAESIAAVPMSSSAEVNDAVAAAGAAFPAWRRTPPGERIQYLFALKRILDDNIRDLAKTITMECGKTLAEAEGELRRGIENVEVACGIPTLMMGANVEDIARGIDEFMVRQPVGVVAIITPFNFPGMIPLWFIPYAIACGNCAIVKPSEKTPVTMARFFELVEATHLPAGVLNLVRVGNGLDEGIEMGPVITPESRQRIHGLLAGATRGGAKTRVGGADARVPGGPGNFVAPTVLEDIRPDAEIARSEVFGPVLSVLRVQTIDEAIAYVNRSAYGNMACLFTRDGLAARRFRYEAEVGNVGINVGVAAPMAYFPFSGWKESFFGDLHAQGRDAIDFYTEKKVVVERWPTEWSRKF